MQNKENRRNSVGLTSPK